MDTLSFYLQKYKSDKDKFSFLPTWVDTQLFSINDLPKASIRKKIVISHKISGNETHWILFVGRLQQQKAPRKLIDSFAEYLKSNSSACLIIVGEGDLKKETIQYVENLNLKEHVYFLGNIMQEQLAKFYQAADIFLMTSNFEGMPISVLEALQCGLPVVSTEVGEIRRVVKNRYSGEVVTTHSPKDISLAVETVLTNTSRYLKENCTKAVAEYTPRKVLEPVFTKMRDMYNERWASR